MIYSFNLYGNNFKFNTLEWEELNSGSYILPSNYNWYEIEIQNFNCHLIIRIHNYFLRKIYNNSYKQPMQFDSIDDAKEHIEKFLRTLSRLKAFI